MRISHFGANPVRGGSPARDSRINGVIDARTGETDQEVARALRLVEPVSLKVRNVADVIIM